MRVVSPGLARLYSHARDLLQLSVSLIDDRDIADEDVVEARSYEGELQGLSVGRLDSDKNPLLLPEIMALLRRDDAAWRLVAVGKGALAPAVADRARGLGVDDAVELRGYVRHGAELGGLYRSSHAFLHVSTTEGLPQVLFEAHGAGLPIVATDVGGVAAALGHGDRGLLVPRGDAAAAADACTRLRHDPQLRERLIRNGLEFARAESIEAQLERLVPFLEAHRRR